MTEKTVDRMAAALTAVSLIEQPQNNDLDALLPTEMSEALTVLASTVSFTHMLMGQLTLYTGISRDDITAALRDSVTDAFANPEGDTHE